MKAYFIDVTFDNCHISCHHSTSHGLSKNGVPTLLLRGWKLFTFMVLNNTRMTRQEFFTKDIQKGIWIINMFADLYKTLKQLGQ